jgi:hypothetical protein
MWLGKEKYRFKRGLKIHIFCDDGCALATMWQDDYVFLFRVRHSSKGLKDVGPVTHQHFGVYTSNSIASRLRGIEFLAMRL